MQILGTVPGDCNTLDRLMLGGIVIPDEKLRLRTRKIYNKDVAMLKFAKFAQLCTALNLKIDNSFTLLHSYHCRRGNT